MSKSFCKKCGNMGRLVEGKPCPDCISSMLSEYEFGVNLCQFIPEQYRNIHLNRMLIRSNSEKYKEFLIKLKVDILSGYIRNYNLMIISPPSSSKTVMVYDTLEELARRGHEVVPYYDLLEIKHFLIDGHKADDLIYRVPYLFVKIPLELTPYIFNTANTLIDRRVRRGGSTIFMYSGTYSHLVQNDKIGLLGNTKGDGSYKTLRIEQFI